MELLGGALEAAADWLPLLAALAAVLAALAVLSRSIRRRDPEGTAARFRGRLVLLLVATAGALLVVALVPVAPAQRGNWMVLLGTVAAVAVSLMVVHHGLKQRWRDQPEAQFRFQLIMLVLTLAGLLAVIVALPLDKALKTELLKLLGVLLSAAIALSSTTFIGNIMAGVMLKAIRSVRPGDFITLGELTGRVTEMDLLHTEVQTEFRDLVTVPNLNMVTQPIKVVRASGTIITAEVSLGYDVPHGRIGELLNAAAAAAGLKDSFVHVRELGDFSVTYRVAGLLEDVNSLISARSALRVAMLDGLHQAGIEIVSPNFMNTRALAADQRVLPVKSRVHPEPAEEAEARAEAIAFDKADEAAAAEALRKEIAGVDAELAELPAEDDHDRAREALERRKERLAARLGDLDKRLKDKDAD